ncbi:GIN domain-containing protein [Pinibacter aurantiacus]|uniref:DUF2807 domain-containing protein n=1 Tax=Pinibacter aurantiacus TaxID=2851599 RepID=A0A9E2S9N7_9BACT|nr:DUF2807 domain-containing protein [Pinibacter aurantiacus]MBV4355915.1 DUF2807 domain-containing protein [Pinibacter aurantiacus]
MKLSSKILLATFLLMIAAVLSSNMILKKQYDQIDKSDIYWTYDKILESPFRHLKITGGNSTNIYYEQSEKPSVRVSRDWVNYHGGHIKAEVKNDTLFLSFDQSPANGFEKFWLQNAEPVRIFSPELLSVTGNNTNFEMQKLRQKTLTVNMSGHSRFEVESLWPDMDSINITQRDSTKVVFEMSTDYRKSSPDAQPKGKVVVHNIAGVRSAEITAPPTDYNGGMTIRSVTADIKGHSILDIGHAQIQNLQLQIQDTSAIVLSGNALKLSKQ